MMREKMDCDCDFVENLGVCGYCIDMLFNVGIFLYWEVNLLNGASDFED